MLSIKPSKPISAGVSDSERSASLSRAAVCWGREVFILVLTIMTNLGDIEYSMGATYEIGNVKSESRCMARPTSAFRFPISYLLFEYSISEIAVFLLKTKRETGKL